MGAGVLGPSDGARVWGFEAGLLLPDASLLHERGGAEPGESLSISTRAQTQPHTWALCLATGIQKGCWSVHWSQISYFYFKNESISPSTCKHSPDIGYRSPLNNVLPLITVYCFAAFLLLMHFLAVKYTAMVKPGSSESHHVTSRGWSDKFYMSQDMLLYLWWVLIGNCHSHSLLCWEMRQCFLACKYKAKPSNRLTLLACVRGCFS